MTTTWSIIIDVPGGETLDFYETTAPNRADALCALYTAAIGAAITVADQARPEKLRYTLDLDHGFHAIVHTGLTSTGEPDHHGARAALDELRDRYCNTY